MYDPFRFPYGLNKKYGTSSSFSGYTYTEFLATLDGNSPQSSTLYSGSGVSVPLGQQARVSVNPPSTITTDIGHTHPFNGVPSDGHDFSWQRPEMSSQGLWSVVVTPKFVYFTGPNEGQYYYLPTSDFVDAGKANNETVNIPSKPPVGPF